MLTLLEIYSKVRDAVYKLNEYEQQINRLNINLESAIKKEKDIRGKMFGFGTFGCILAWIWIILGFIIGSIIGAIAGFLIYFAICFVIDLLLFEKRREQKADKLHAQLVSPLEEQLSVINNKVERLYGTKAIQFYLEHLPPECQSLEAMDFFVESLTYKKAETEKELFLQWENEIYRRQMLHMQEEQIRQIKQVHTNQQQQSQVMSNQTKLLEKQLAQQKKLSKQVRYGNVVNTLDFLSKD